MLAWVMNLGFGATSGAAPAPVLPPVTGGSGGEDVYESNRRKTREILKLKRKRTLQEERRLKIEELQKKADRQRQKQEDALAEAKSLARFIDRALTRQASIERQKKLDDLETQRIDAQKRAAEARDREIAIAFEVDELRRKIRIAEENEAAEALMYLLAMEY